MTVLSGEFLLSSFKGHVHNMWYVWLLYCNIETNKAADSANIFLKRVIKEVIFINMNVEDKDVCKHFLHSWSEFRYLLLTISKTRSPLKQPFSSPTFLKLLWPKERFTPMSICGYTLQCFLLGGPLPATQTQKPAKLQHCALLFIWSLASNWNAF